MSNDYENYYKLRSDWIPFGPCTICDYCGTLNTYEQTDFCPHCGSPMTHEALLMLVRRILECESENQQCSELLQSSTTETEA